MSLNKKEINSILNDSSLEDEEIIEKIQNEIRKFKLKELYKKVDYYFNGEKDRVYKAIDKGNRGCVWDLASKSFRNLEKFLEVLDDDDEVLITQTVP